MPRRADQALYGAATHRETTVVALSDSKRCAHHVGDRFGTCFREQGFHSGKIQRFITQREDQMSGKMIVRLVAGCVNVPTVGLVDL